MPLERRGTFKVLRLSLDHCSPVVGSCLVLVLSLIKMDPTETFMHVLVICIVYFVTCLDVQLSSDFYSLQYFLESGAYNIYLST